jgi:hypothetical protein
MMTIYGRNIVKKFKKNSLTHVWDTDYNVQENIKKMQFYKMYETILKRAELCREIRDKFMSYVLLYLFYG